MVEGRGKVLEIPVDDAVFMQVLHTGQHGAALKPNGWASRFYYGVETDRTYRSTATAFRAEKWLR